MAIPDWPVDVSPSVGRVVRHRLEPYRVPGRGGAEQRTLDPDGLTRYEHLYHASRPHPLWLRDPVLRTLLGLVLILWPAPVFLLPLAFGYYVYMALPFQLLSGRFLLLSLRLWVAVAATILLLAAPPGGFQVAAAFGLVFWL